MKHGKRELPRKRKPLLTRVLLTALVLGLAVVGVAAYLSVTSNKVENTFNLEDHPVVTVSDSGITVTDPGYAVYLRAAVVANWVDSAGNVLAENPDVTLGVQDGWKEVDGFYYYTSRIIKNSGETQRTISLPVSLPAQSTTNGDYTLKVSIAAQTVQAVGTTDDGAQDAVEAAWGIKASEFIG